MDSDYNLQDVVRGHLVKLNSLLCTVTSVIQIYAMLAKQHMFQNYQNLTKLFHFRSATPICQNIIVKLLICTVQIVTFVSVCSVKRASTLQNYQSKNY